MRVPRLFPASLVFLLFVTLGFVACTNQPSGPAANAPTPMLGSASSPAPAPSPLSAVIPGKPDFSNLPDNPSLQQVQHDFDVFSWQSFVALNWPVDGQVIGSAPNGDNPATWETYIESYQVFLPNAQTPSWDSRPIPPACQNTGAQKLPVFQMTMKVSDQVLKFSQQAFGTGPLIDQRGDYVRYSINLNRDAFDYILNNKLYSQDAQKNFDNVSFPVANPSPSPGTVGSIVLKSAWRILDAGKGDDLSRYHKLDALVYTPAPHDPPTQPTCEKKTLGLVGLHIAHKTPTEPQWVWSTFEQVDNVQVGQNAPAGLKPTFFNPDCKDCRVNKPPPRPWNPNTKATPSQVVRVIPVNGATRNLNGQWQGFLLSVNKNSVWQYYELVSTQWPTQPAPATTPNPYDPHPTGNPAPQFLANTTIETYIQGKVPNTSSSCILCHNNATTTASKFADFSYLLQRAQKEAQK